jgi:chromosomal replication initiation ATPase DnaA
MTLPPRSRAISFIIETVAEDFGMTAQDLLDRNKFEPVDSVRAMAIRLIRDVVVMDGYRGGHGANTGPAYQRIGMVFGRDHSSIISAYRGFGQRLRDNAWLRARYERLRRHVENELYPQEAEEGAGETAVLMTACSS